MNVPETFFTIQEELTLFGLSCLFGAALGVYYDIFRCLRLIFPHNRIMTASEDILFLMGYGIFLTAFASAAARGELRFYFIIGNSLGFIVYLLTIGSLITRILKKILNLIKIIVGIIFKPFKRIYVKFVGDSKNKVKNIKNSGIDLQNDAEM
ncbi:MAG: spore cortex biosynthesis protein YabQ [Ruminococcus sp.]|nr:spore cortex biosynthesis protein YabQ [Ruminococcus sp.]